MKNILTQSLAKYYLPASSSYSFTKGNTAGNVAVLNAQRSASKMIQHFFAPIKALASKPVFSITTDKVIVTVFYYLPVTNQAINNNTINNLGDVLSKLFGRPVELRFVKLHYPYLNSYILAQYIALNVEKYNFNQVQRMILGKTPIVKDTHSSQALASELPSHIVGIKVRISGRLLTERVRPRQTVLNTQIGSFSPDNKSFIDYDSFTSKNTHGAYTVKVWISQRAN